MTIHIDPPEEPFPPMWAYFTPGEHDEALTAHECDQMISWATTRPVEVLAKHDVNGRMVDPEHLSIDRYAIDVEPEMIAGDIPRRIVAASSGANDAWWKIDVRRLSRLNVLHYAEGHEYVTHVDLARDKATVKLSIIALLSDRSSFTGGDLEMMVGDHFELVPMVRGTIVVFPSFIPHRVTRVEDGDRWSLVCWLEGPPFR